MSLIQMSVSGAVMISVTIIVRALFIRILPKRTFPVMWSVIMARLLIPFSLPCPFSVYSLLTVNGTAEKTAGNTAAAPVPSFPEGTAYIPFVPEPPALPELSTVNNAYTGLPFDIWTAVWLTGMTLCTVIFAAAYIKCRIRFGESLPADNEFIGQWLAEHKRFRQISVRRSDRISSPLTYGIFRPVILLPKSFGSIDADDLNFVLTHEYVHIQRFDAVFKLMLAAALCVHWFDPMVWVMYVIANRDIELSCDEAVIRMLGEHQKKRYAMTLIRMEEAKSGFAPLINGFGKNPVKERIIGIMKFRKTTLLTALASALIVVGTTTVFATSAKQPDDAPADAAEVSTSEIAPNEEPSDSTSETSNSLPETSNSTPDISESSSEPTDSIPEPPAEEKAVSVSDWLKQPHCPPLANVNAELKSDGSYTFIPASPGSEVYSIADGEVVYARVAYNSGYGAVVVVRHDGDIYTIYCHLDPNKGFEVGVGDKVTAGQCVGYAGISGRAVSYGLGFKCVDKMPCFDLWGDGTRVPINELCADMLLDSPPDGSCVTLKEYDEDGNWSVRYLPLLDDCPLTRSHVGERSAGKSYTHEEDVGCGYIWW